MPTDLTEVHQPKVRSIYGVVLAVDGASLIHPTVFLVLVCWFVGFGFGVGFGGIEWTGRADKRSAIRHDVHKPLPFFMEPASYREFNLHNTGTKHK